jgi:hypothetical protein
MTNLLWTLIIAAELAIVRAPPGIFAVLVSLLCVVFAAFRLVQINQELGGPRIVGLLAAALLLLSQDMLLAVTNGLEGALYLALLVEALYRYTRDHDTLAFVFIGLLFATRPEGLVLGPLLALAVVVKHRTIRPVLPGLGVLTVIVLCVTGFRLAYYGSPMPNSVIAKSLSLEQIQTTYAAFYRTAVPEYFKGFIQNNRHFVLLFCVLLVLVLTLPLLKAKSRGLVLFCFGAIVFSYLVTARNGGDWMPNHRLLTQYGALYIMPLLALPTRRVWAQIVIGLVVATALAQTIELVQKRGPATFALRIDDGQHFGFWNDAVNRLDPVLRPDDTISAEALGYISYHLPHTYVHDPIGLTDAHLARHGRPAPLYGKTDINYTLGVVRPSVLVWHWLGHVQPAPQELVDQYTMFCAAECDSWTADVIMVRNDRLPDFAPAVADWQTIRVVDRAIQIP